MAKCALCKTEATLIRSHIVPRWAYKRVLRVSGPDASTFVLVKAKTAAYSGQQWAEHMLCADCEKRFKKWEDHAHALSLQLDGSFPALRQSKVVATQGTTRLLDVSSHDTAQIVRFAVSVFWRAHASKKHFREITLGSYGDAIAAYLLDDAAPHLPEQTFLFLHLVEPKPSSPIDQIVAPPWMRRSGSCRLHQFLVFGMWFWLFVGGDAPHPIPIISLDRSPWAFASEGDALVQGVLSLAQTAVTKGTLAQHRRAT